MINTEQQLRAEIADLRVMLNAALLDLDAVGAGGVGNLMPPAAQKAKRTAAEQEAVDRLIAHVEQHHKIKTGEQKNFESLVASLLVAARMGKPLAAQTAEPCEMSVMCLDCTPRTESGDCPGIKPNGVCECYQTGFADGMAEAPGVQSPVRIAAMPEFEVWVTVTEEGNFLESGVLLRHVLGRRALISLGDVAAAWPKGVL